MAVSSRFKVATGSELLAQELEVFKFLIISHPLYKLLVQGAHKESLSKQQQLQTKSERGVGRGHEGFDRIDNRNIVPWDVAKLCSFVNAIQTYC